MRCKSTFLFFAMILLTSCTAPTAPQTSEVSKTSEVLTATPTSSQTAVPTLTQPPEPALPSYGEIDPKVADKLKAEGINIPEELLDPEYELDLATELQKTEWGNAYGLEIPITVIPENGIAYGKYHIKGIGATQEAWDEYAKQHIKYMWIHYREFGNEADREITLEQYVELLKAGRGGFEIPQYNPETGFFDKKAMVNPLAGFTKIISDNTFKELPLKGTTENSMLFYVDSNGMIWIAMNDLEFSIEHRMDPNNNNYKNKPYKRDPYIAKALLGSSGYIGILSNECLAVTNSVASCVREGAKLDDKYTDLSVGIIPLFNEWLAKYEAGDHSAQPPMWIDH